MPLTGLKVPPDNAKQKIRVQLGRGKTILHDAELTLWTYWNPEKAQVEGSDWVRHTRRILQLVFYSDSLAREFDPEDGVDIARAADDKNLFQQIMDDYIRRLDSIYERVDLLPLGPVEDETQGGRGTIPMPSSPTMSPYVFISHSSQDQKVIRIVTQALEESELKPLFIEQAPQGTTPVGSICEQVAASEAMFAFFTSHSIADRTRDWVVFELGIARANGKQIFVWVHNEVQKEQLPTFLYQLTTTRVFDPQTPEGALEFEGDVKRAAKKVSVFRHSQK